VATLETPTDDNACTEAYTPPAPVCTQGASVPWYVGHGLCMLLGWGFLLPSGVLAARLLKHRPAALWFRAHKTLQPAGLLVALVGFAIALARFDVFTGTGSRALGAVHGGVGVTVMALGLLQPVNAYFRPHKEAGHPVTVRRRRWELLHKNSGRTAVVLGVVNAGLGMTLPGGAVSTGFMAAYFVVLAALAGLWVAFTRDRDRSGGGGEAHKSTGPAAEMVSGGHSIVTQLSTS
jgi:hypothetical protein